MHRIISISRFVYIYWACLCVLGSNCAYLAGVKYTLDTERSKLKSMARYEILNVYVLVTGFLSYL